MIVEKKVFELPRFTTQGGALLRNVRIGWESYGRLNRDRSNAILVTHYFSATSHAAGRYAADDALPGYWDAIIGPGKAIDTDKYFVLSSDTLVNLNARDPKSSRPARPRSIRRPASRYGMRFPVVSIDDFVERAEGARREPRHHAAAGDRRPLHGRAAGLPVGGVASRRWWTGSCR